MSNEGAEATVCPICGQSHASSQSCSGRIGSEPDRTRYDSPLDAWPMRSSDTPGSPSDTPGSPSDTPLRTRERRPDAIPHPVAGESTSPIGVPQSGEDLPRGTQIGEFIVEGQIGAGGMGVVYRAIHPLIGKKAVVKVIRAGLGGDVEHVQRFIREARAVNQIGHPNIVDVFSFGLLPDKRPYLIMEWLQGESLGSRLERGRIPPREAIEILLQIAGALDAAHTYGVIHRDLKPDNVYLVALPNDDKPLVKLLDFGLAKITEAHKDLFLGDDEEGVIVGTPSYLAPEVARGLTVDHRSDLYALGVMAFEMLTGRRPFLGRTPRETIFMHVTAPPPSARKDDPSIPMAVDVLLIEMMAKQPEQRPSLSRVRTILGALSSQLELVAASDPPEEETTGARTADFAPVLRKLAATDRPREWPELRSGLTDLEEPPREEPPREVTRTDAIALPPPRERRDTQPQASDRLSAVGIVVPALPPAMPALVAEDLEDDDATRLADAVRAPRAPIQRTLGSMPSINEELLPRPEPRVAEPPDDSETAPVPRVDAWDAPKPTPPKSASQGSFPSLPRLPRTGLMWRLRVRVKAAWAWVHATLLESPDRRRITTIVGTAVLLSLALVLLLAHRDGHDDVRLWVRGLPQGSTLRWDGAPLRDNPAHVPKSSDTKQLTIVSPGYDTLNVALVPTRDIEFTVELRNSNVP